MLQSGSAPRALHWTRWDGHVHLQINSTYVHPGPAVCGAGRREADGALVAAALSEAGRGQCPGVRSRRDQAPVGRVGALQDTAFDLGLAGQVKHGQVEMGSRGNILESEVWFAGVPAGKGFSWAIKGLWVRRAISSPEGAPRKTRPAPEPRDHSLPLLWAPGGG